MTAVAARHHPLGLLRQRNFRLLWTGETVSTAGNAMATVGVPLLAVTALHASTFAVAVLTAAAYLPWLVIGLPAGAWVDRLPPRPLMITCDVLSALLFASLPIAAWTGTLSAPLVVVVALLAGAVNVFFATAYQVYLPSLVTRDELVEGNAKLQAGLSVASIVGRGAVGLAQAVGAAPALLFNAGSFLVSAACLLRIHPPDPAPALTPAAPAPAPASGAAPSAPQPKVRSTVRAEVAEGVRWVARDPYFRPLTLYAALSNLAYSGSVALVVVFLVRVVGLGSLAVGLVTATGGLGGLVGALMAGRLARTFGSARTLLLTSLGSGLFSLLIPLTAPGPRIACYVVGSAIVSGGIIVSNVIAASFRQEYCPPSMLGRATASMRLVAFGAVPLGALLAGALGTALGVRNGLWADVALYAASGSLLLTRRIRTTRDLPRRPS
ncbi:MAG TPA: MFS transporter [Streptosporangiaceae bacterium]